MQVRMRAPQHFDLEATVFSHGWIFLPPFSWKEDSLRAHIRGEPYPLSVTVTTPSDDRQALLIDIDAKGEVHTDTKRIATESVRWILRLDEDLTAATPLLEGDPHMAAALRQGAGRFLRAPNIWEEAVRILCTTNINWRGTVGMVTRLVALARGSFPTPACILAANQDRLRQTGLGYRLPYLLALAHRFSSADSPALWGDNPVSRESIRQEIGTWPGFGPYATAHMLVQLGDYGDIPIDSEVRAFHPGMDDKGIRTLYAPYAPFDFLAYKLRRIGMQNNWIGGAGGEGSLPLR